MKTLTSLPWASESYACTPTCEMLMHIFVLSRRRCLLRMAQAYRSSSIAGGAMEGTDFSLLPCVPGSLMLRFSQQAGSLSRCCLAMGVLALRQGKLTSFSEAEHLNSHSGPCSPWESAEYIAFSKD